MIVICMNWFSVGYLVVDVLVTGILLRGLTQTYAGAEDLLHWRWTEWMADQILSDHGGMLSRTASTWVLL